MKCLAKSGPGSDFRQRNRQQSLYGGFSAVNVVLKNLDVRTYDNPGIGGIDLQHALQCKLENVFINTGVYNVRASKPTRQTSGLISPAINNAAWTVLRNVTVTGYHNGIVVNEHTDGDNIVIGSNINGLNFAQAHHASRFARVSSCRNVNTVTVSGAHGFSIEQLNIEQPGPNQTDTQNHWQTTESDVNDPRQSRRGGHQLLGRDRQCRRTGCVHQERRRFDPSPADWFDTSCHDPAPRHPGVRRTEIAD